MAWSALFVFVTIGYFKQWHPGWNVNSQLDMPYAIVERGTLRIDAYHGFEKMLELGTSDKAFVGGHFYTDKSPVTPLLGVPAFALYRGWTALAGATFTYRDARYWTTWLTIGALAALLAAMLTLTLAQMGAGPAAAGLASALWITATPLLGYSILFFNYTPACVMALGGFMLARREWSAALPARRNMFFAGVLVGLAVWTLNTLAIVALLLTIILMVAPVESGGWIAMRWRRLWPWALGGVLGAIGHFIYMRAVFGVWLGSPYDFEFESKFRVAMSQGLMGAGLPRAIVAWAITFSPFLGLFFWWPLTLAAMLGCAWMLVRGRRGERFDSFAALGLLGILILYNSGYYMWWGGRAYAPRHLIPALALLGIGMAPFLRDRRMKYVVLAIGAIGTLVNLAPVAIDPQPWNMLTEEQLLKPETVQHWPAVNWELQKLVWTASPKNPYGVVSPNWGTDMGLMGHNSLIPLFAIWFMLLALFWTGVRLRLFSPPDTPS
ncbi:hypothetical protein LLG95_09360 [bacterium]|nr:hypothetical protein [bacterium]